MLPVHASFPNRYKMQHVTGTAVPTMTCSVQQESVNNATKGCITGR